MTDEHKSLNQIIEFRKEKLTKLKENGVNPYPVSYQVSHSAVDIIDQFDKFNDKTVRVAGRIMSLRKMGKAAFCHIQDQTTRLQIYVKRDDLGQDEYQNFKLLDIGDFIGVKGYVFKTKTGEISVHAQKVTILSKSIRPIPIVKEKEGEVYDAFGDKEQRYRNRHIDLIVNPDVRQVFIQRAKIISEARTYLEKHGYIEVETPVLQPLYGGANARPFVTHHNTLEQDLYLRIAVELYLKRLIIGGFDKVYELSKIFRNEGMDWNHNPEFTMLEFYQAYVDYEFMMDFVEDLIRSIAEKFGGLKRTWCGKKIDLKKPFMRKPILELVKEHTGHDVSAADLTEFKKIYKSLDLELPDETQYGILLDDLMSQAVEPNLIQPVFVIDYPKAVSPLAKPHRSGDANIVERFELFIGGMEFANAFSELNDPIDQRKRFEDQMQLRIQGDEEAHPLDENFLEAVESGMPPTGGVGIGIDRLVMLLTETNSIKDVILFPAMRT
ncbi:MAG: lysine--tRNA ligase [Candidatus Neomarinimicrobiota bacterium]